MEMEDWDQDDWTRELDRLAKVAEADVNLAATNNPAVDARRKWQASRLIATSRLRERFEPEMPPLEALYAIRAYLQP